MEDDRTVAERYAEGTWQRFARRYGVGAQRPPVGYVDKYVNEVSGYGVTDAKQRLDQFTREIVTPRFMKQMISDGFVRVESRLYGVMLSRIRAEIRARDLRPYAMEGVVVLVLVQDEPSPHQILGGVQVEVIYGSLDRSALRVTPDAYVFRRYSVGLAGLEQFMDRLYQDFPTLWILNDEGITVRGDPSLAGTTLQATPNLLGTSNRTDIILQLSTHERMRHRPGDRYHAPAASKLEMYEDRW